MRSEFNEWYANWTGSEVKCENPDVFGAWNHQQSKVDELQKRVDQQGLIIARVMSIASELQKSWAMFEIGKNLEQALKGGNHEAN